MKRTIVDAADSPPLLHHRTRALQAVVDEPAPVDLLPRRLRWLSALLVPLLKMQVRGTLRKYPVPFDEAVAREQLDKLRHALKELPPDAQYLLGEFSFAGVAPATCAARCTCAVHCMRARCAIPDSTWQPWQWQQVRLCYELLTATPTCNYR